MTEQTQVLGRRVDRVTMIEAVDLIQQWLSDDGQAVQRLVITANPEILMGAGADPYLAAALDQADLVVADGIGVVWAAGQLGRPVPERVPGVELMGGILERAAAAGHRPYFLGTRPQIVAQAVRTARGRYRGLEVAGWHHGYFGVEEEPAVLEKIRAAAPDLLFAGMGAARELKWLRLHQKELGVPVCMGVGGSLDVLGGAAARAPLWIRRLHLEWFYRLLRDPARWRRQLVLPRFVLAVLAERFRGRR
ncbi:MAG: WecB/TagA/CpsF family glycosyltransferase [Thermaerobacterales bacterium]